MNVLSIRDLTVRYGHGKSATTALQGVDLHIPEATTVGLVGESGSGKSTLARAVIGLVPVASGTIALDGHPIDRLRTRLRASLAQMVFQDPYGSLNPRLTVRSTLEEALVTHGRARRRDLNAEVVRLLGLVHLQPAAADRYPHQFSGGERQRVAIARALAVQPSLLIADEITSALDVSVQAQVLNLLRELQRELGLALLFISHDLGVVRYMCEQITVLYLGRVMERAPTDALFRDTRHPYTRALIDAVPELGGKGGGGRLPGEIPDPRHPPSGCVFHTRCPVGPRLHLERADACGTAVPAEDGSTSGHTWTCHFPLRSNGRASENGSSTNGSSTRVTEAS